MSYPGFSVSGFLPSSLSYYNRHRLHGYWFWFFLPVVYRLWIKNGFIREPLLFLRDSWFWFLPSSLFTA